MAGETANLYTAFVARRANPDKIFVETQAGRRIRCREAFDLAGQTSNVLTASTQIDASPYALDDLAAIRYTSGPTGRSTGAMLTHRNLHSNAATLATAGHYTTYDVLPHALPLFHTHDLFAATTIILMAGAVMILMPKFDPTAIREKLPQATVMMKVPTFYTRLLQED